MHIFMFCCGLGALIFGLYCSFKQHSTHDINQAALLPFADDPDAAQRITKATGMQFDQVVDGTEAEYETMAHNELDCFIA